MCWTTYQLEALEEEKQRQREQLHKLKPYADDLL